LKNKNPAGWLIPAGLILETIFHSIGFHGEIFMRENSCPYFCP